MQRNGTGRAHPNGMGCPGERNWPPVKGRAIAFGIPVLPNVNVHGTRGRFWSSSTANFTRFLHEHGLTVSNAIPLRSKVKLHAIHLVVANGPDETKGHPHDDCSDCPIGSSEGTERKRDGQPNQDQGPALNIKKGGSEAVVVSHSKTLPRCNARRAYRNTERETILMQLYMQLGVAARGLAGC